VIRIVHDRLWHFVASALAFSVLGRGGTSDRGNMDQWPTQNKWRQFLEDAHVRWHFLDADDHSIKSPNDVAVRLSEHGGLSDSRSQREVHEMIELFEEKIRRAA